MRELIKKIRNTRDIENLKEILGNELGTLLYTLIDEADKDAQTLANALHQIEKPQADKAENNCKMVYGITTTL